MATPVLEGLTRIDPADSATGWADIGGGPGSALNNDVVRQGTGSIGRRIDANDRGFAFDLGAGNELDFSGSGAHEGEHIWWWVNILQPDLINSHRLRLITGTTLTTNYAEYEIFPAQAYSGGWFRAVLDPSRQPTSTAGTFNLASVRNIGFMFDMGNVGGTSQNCLVDAVDRGRGLVVTGGTSGDPLTWADIAAEDELNANQFGVVQELGNSGQFGVLGELTFGDDGTLVSPNSDAYLDDRDAILTWLERVYRDDTSPGDVKAVEDGLYKLKITGQAGTTTSFINGTKIGSGDTAVGANGCQYIGGPGQNQDDVAFDASDASIDTLNLYGTVIRNFQGGISLPDVASVAEFVGSTVAGSAQADVGRAETRNSVFSGTTNPDGALLWNANIDIRNSRIEANTSDPESPNETCGIEHDFAEFSPTTVVTYDGLQFTGNDFDICLTAEGELVVQAQNGANPGTFRLIASPSDVDIQNAVGLTVTCKNSQGVDLQGIRVRIEEDPGGNLIAEGETDASGVFSASFNYTADQDVIVRARLKGFVPNSAAATIESTGLSVPFTMILDTSVNLP